MDRLGQIELFMAVAQSRSFTAAAKRFGLSRASVTKQVSALERQLGVLLLVRNTHHVAPTEAGLMLLEKGADLVSDFHAIEADLRRTLSEPSGIIRLGAPPSFGAAHLVPAIAAFTARNPGTRVVMCLDTGDAELVRDGLDLSVRISSALKDASYIAKLLLRVPQVLVASPAYAERRGLPATLDELGVHDCLVHSLKAPSRDWTFGAGEGTRMVAVRGPLMADFGEPLRSAALLGQGISMHPVYMVADDIAAGRLVVVLPDDPPSGLGIHVIYPQRNVSARVRAFLDFLADWLPREPTWLPEDASAVRPSRSRHGAARRAAGNAP